MNRRGFLSRLATAFVVAPLAAAGVRLWNALPDGNSHLIDALGGDSAVLGFYDVRNDVTSSGGIVDRWDDTRGTSGFGPALQVFDLSRAKTIVYLGEFPP